MTGFCLDVHDATPAAAIAAIDGNICRCTGYKSIERAAMRLNTLLNERKGQSTLPFAIEKAIIPAYFSDIPRRLAALESPTAPHPIGSIAEVGVGT